MTKEELLSSVFSDRTPPVRDVTEKAAERSRMVKSSENAYAKLLARVDRIKPEPGIGCVVRAWIKEGNPVVFCVLSNDIAGYFTDELRDNLIPFISDKKIRRTIFIARGSDKEDFERCLRNIILASCNAPFAYSYTDFVTFAEKKGKNTAYIRGLSEIQMESIRRIFDRSDPGRRYTFFRMSDNRWGIGFLASDLTQGSKPASGLFSAYLSALFMITGTYKQYRLMVKQDFYTDRLAAERFAPLLEDKSSVFVYNPCFPKQALRVYPKYFTRVDISHKSSGWNIRESPEISLTSEIGEKLYRKELLRMGHRSIAYTSRELLESARAWRDSEKNAIKKVLALTAARKTLGKTLYEVFERMNSGKDWYKDSLKTEVQTEEFLNFSENVIGHLANGEMPAEFTSKEAKTVVKLMEKGSVDKRVFERVLMNIRDLDIVRSMEIEEPVYESKMTPLKQLFAALEKEMQKAAVAKESERSRGE